MQLFSARACPCAHRTSELRHALSPTEAVRLLEDNGFVLTKAMRARVGRPPPEVRPA